MIRPPLPFVPSAVEGPPRTLPLDFARGERLVEARHE
jgi:hypothetical protein